nr:hypothetical protein [Saprospiraceae bacterium]
MSNLTKMYFNVCSNRRFLLLFSLTLLLAAGCQKDDDFAGIDNDGDRLVRVVGYYQSKEQFVSDYIYDDQNQVIKTHFRHVTAEGTRFYTYNQTGRLSQAWTINHLPDNQTQSKTTFEYDEEGRLVEFIEYVSSDGGVTFEEPDRHRTKYYYDDTGELYRKETIFSDSVDIENSSRYTVRDIYYEWQNGNIVKEEWYNTLGVKTTTRIFAYDNKVNFRNDQSNFFVFPENLSRNNFVREITINHLDPISGVYFPSITNCTIRYQYNRSGKPASFYRSSRKEWRNELTYE